MRHILKLKSIKKKSFLLNRNFYFLHESLFHTTVITEKGWNYKIAVRLLICNIKKIFFFFFLSRNSKNYVVYYQKMQEICRRLRIW